MRCSIAANASPPISAASADAGTAPIRITCRASHRRYAEWTPERFQRWARAIGPHTEGLILAVLASRPHPEQGLRTCLGVRRLYRGLDPARAEAVSARAVAIGALTAKSIACILAHNLDRTSPQTGSAPVIDHPNVRGSRYFH